MMATDLDQPDMDWRVLTSEHIQNDQLRKLFERAIEIIDSALGPRIPGVSSWGQLSLCQFLEFYKYFTMTALKPADVIMLHQLEYWTQVRCGYLHFLRSMEMKQAFYHIESTPLLCILEDCLEDIENVLQPRPKEESLDEVYVSALEVSCLLRQRKIDIGRSWQNVTKMSLSLHNEHACFAQSHYPQILSTLEQLIALVQKILDKYSMDEQTTTQPKFVQLCKRLNLTVKETDAFSYLFVQNVGVRFGKLYSRFTTPSSATSLGGSRHSSMALAAAGFAELSSKEMCTMTAWLYNSRAIDFIDASVKLKQSKVEFFNGSRTHMKQEVLEPEDEFSTVLTTNFIKIPITVLRACCGCTLSADELYKVDKTAMGDVLAVQSVPEEDLELNENEVLDLDEAISKMGISSADEEKELTMELEEILKTCSKAEPRLSERPEPDMPTNNTGLLSAVSPPYCTDLEYLEDNFQLIETLVKAVKTELSDDSLLFRADQRKPEAVIRELKAKARSLKAKTEQRLEATRIQSDWLPRLERLAELRGLDTFEKNVLLVLTGSMVSKNLRNTGNPNDVIFGHHLSIGSLVGLFCEGLKEQIDSRVYFYKNSKLVSEGLVHISDPPLRSRGNFLDSVVELDRRLLDYIVGLDTEISELVDGSDLYTPQVTLDDVALPEDHRELLVTTLQSFEKFQKTCKKLEIAIKSSSKGLCMLFYGPSGTGKTMTANAVANYLSKKVLLVTISALMDRDLTKELLCFLFREAKIHNAVLFFDECETLFETRENRPNQTLGVLLTEIEQYDGMIILATNRHQDLDEAMHRRIQLSLAFSVPDYALRVVIWKSHVPAAIASPDINWTNLALNHELTGGLICNAVLSAISLALKTCINDEDLLLTEQYLQSGAKLQLRGLLEMVDFDRRVIPTFGISDLVLTAEIRQQLQMILKAGKTHKFLSAQWGFGSSENCAEASGISVLICGHPGTGKTAIAHSIAYELGQPIKEANCTELLSHSVSMNPRASRGVAAFFRDAHKANAVVVLDGADVLLSNSGSSLMSGIVGCEHYTLAHQIEHYHGVIILTSRRELGHLDLGRIPQLRHILDIGIPSAELREKLWKKLLPKKAPVASNIDFEALAQSYEFTGGEISNVLCQAAESCAMLTDAQSTIDQEKLREAAELEMKRKQAKTTFLPSIYE